MLASQAEASLAIHGTSFSCTFITLKSSISWARRDGAVVKILALHARDPIWAPVLIPAAPLPTQLGDPGSSASHPAPCFWPGKAVENGPKLWDPAPAHRPLRSLGE